MATDRNWKSQSGRNLICWFAPAGTNTVPPSGKPLPPGVDSTLMVKNCLVGVEFGATPYTPVEAGGVCLGLVTFLTTFVLLATFLRIALATCLAIYWLLSYFEY